MKFKTYSKRVLWLLVFTLVIPSLVLFSADGQAEAKKPMVKKGAQEIKVQGFTRNWSDVEKISFKDMTTPRKMKPVLNFKDPRQIVKETNAVDPVAQTDLGKSLQGREALMPSIITQFAGMNLNSNGAGWPPDPNGDVGPTYFIEVVNTSIGIYNKSTGALVSATTFDSFFGGTGITGTPCDSDNNGDPIVLYDQYSQRWFILDFAWASSETDGSYYSIAVSKTSDPTGAWWQYALRADTTLMNDYPKCGIWNDGIYITANMFQFTGTFQYAKVWALKKPDIYNGTLTVQTVTDSNWQAWSLLPSSAKGATAPPTGAPNYMYSVDADEFGSPSIDALYVWKYAVDWTNSANTTWTGPSTMTTAAYGLVSTGVPQQGTTVKLDSLYGRLMYPAMYRNFGTYEAVYLCHVCEYSSRRAMRWYEVRIASGTSSIYQQGTYSPDTNHRWMGSIGADENGNIAMGYSVSSSTMYPSIRYAGRLATDTLGALSQGEATMIAGSGYQSSYTRWGDYTSMTIDPDDDQTFWYTNEYYSSSGTNWQTRMGSFKYDTATTPPDAPSGLTATSTVCTSVTLTWTDNADDESQFNIERSPDGTTYTQIGTVSANVTTYSDTTVAAQTTYYYRVRAYNSAGYSSYSNVASVTTPQCTGSAPAAPTLLTPTRGQTYLTYKWTDNATTETGYRVYRGTTSTNLTLRATLAANTTQYTDSGLSRRTRYYYKICAYNSYGEGCSAVSSATTK